MTETPPATEPGEDTEPLDPPAAPEPEQEPSDPHDAPLEDEEDARHLDPVDPRRIAAERLRGAPFNQDD